MQFSMAAYSSNCIPDIISPPLFGFSALFAFQLWCLWGLVPVGSVCCLRAFFGRKVGSRPEGEFGKLTNAPTLLVGKPPEGHPGFSERLDPPLWGQAIWFGQLPFTAQSGLAQTIRPFTGPDQWLPGWARAASPRPLGDCLLGPHPLRKWGGRNMGFAVSYPGWNFCSTVTGFLNSHRTSQRG